MNNEIKYTKLYLLGGDTDPIIVPTKEEMIDKILSYPAVSMRGDRDELIEHIPSGIPPLQWRKEAKDMLLASDEGYLIMLKNLIQNRIEYGKQPYG